MGFLSARAGDAVNTERGQVDDQIFVSRRQMLEAETNFSELAQRQRREKLELSLQIGTQERQLYSLTEDLRSRALLPLPTMV